MLRCFSAVHFTTMGRLLNCGMCCMLLSGWGVIHLFIFGVFFYCEVPILIKEVEPEEYDDYDDFINKTKNNYRAVAINCWIASGIYIVTFLMSCVCIKKARSNAARLEKLMEDDEYVCNPAAQTKKH